MTSHFRPPAKTLSELPPLPFEPRRAPRRSGPGQWIHSADVALRRLSGGDRIVHNTLRVAAVPMGMGALLVLWAMIF